MRPKPVKLVNSLTHAVNRKHKDNKYTQRDMRTDIMCKGKEKVTAV